MVINKAIIVVGILILLAGCASTSQSSRPGQGVPTEKEYVVNEAEDVISKPSGLRNSEQLDAFISGAIDRVRMVHYTKEGDPIFYSLSKAEDQIEVRYDTSQDKYGSSTIKTYRCDFFIKEEGKRTFTYKLNGCGGAQKSISLLDVPISPAT